MSSVTNVDRKSITSTQNYFMTELKNVFSVGGNRKPLTEEQITLGQNALEVMMSIANDKGKDVLNYPRSKTLFALRRVMSLGWDVQNGEGAIILQGRKINGEWDYYFDVRPTAKGHKKNVRTMGAGLRRDIDPIVADWLVCEGDEFTDIEYVGLEVNPPRFRPKRLSNKVMYIVYGLARADRTTQWVVGYREQVKPALIAQAKSNGSPQADLDKMAKMTVDEILKEYSGKTFEKEIYNQKSKRYEKYPASYLNATWTEEQNRESMIETKLRGVIANRMIDKQTDSPFQEEAFRHTIIEHPDIDEGKDNDSEFIEMADIEIDEGTGVEEIYEADNRMNEEIIVEAEIVDDEEIVVEEKPVETKTKKTTKNKLYDELIDDPVEEKEPKPKAEENLFDFDW